MCLKGVSQRCVSEVYFKGVSQTCVSKGCLKGVSQSVPLRLTIKSLTSNFEKIQLIYVQERRFLETRTGKRDKEEAAAWAGLTGWTAWAA